MRAKGNDGQTGCQGTCVTYFGTGKGLDADIFAYDVREDDDEWPDQVLVEPTRRRKKRNLPAGALSVDWLLLVHPNNDQRTLVKQLRRLANSIERQSLIIGRDRDGDLCFEKDGKILR
jgi:hypothetical protein